MRTILESLHQAPLVGMPFEDLVDELIENLQMSHENVQRWADYITAVREFDAAGDVMAMTSVDYEESIRLSGLDENESRNIRISLGSMAEPYVFWGGGTALVTRENDNGRNGKRGGSLVEVAEVLVTRRPPMEFGEYFPPQEFDAQRLGMPTRDDKALRICVVKEAHLTRMAHSIWHVWHICHTSHILHCKPHLADAGDVWGFVPK
jgi:hypothetical protein